MEDENLIATTLIPFFNNYFPLNSKEKEEVLERFSQRKIKRRGMLLQQGDVCKFFYFVVSGCLKMYVTDDAGKEHNLQFAIEQEWISDLSSFYSEKPSQVFIEAIEPTVVLQIKHADLLHLYIHYHKFDRNFRIITEQKYIALQKRTLENISTSAEVRYHNFVAQHPALALRLPNTQIASYLGITPEFLSKIRKNFTQPS
ncbi:CRP-like cAMP-binding protein [Filimonas zeae]|uniref:Cyclic nucleotide-binding protein n=1 Tax=Filimonas zeae TaxID=1737353 RepID=A0A917INP7_9BACT|nr:Crp/Fnr family transcriptional regulator [Filimonas zeae]MDR6337709.1 CRP-like cAMP-binding protein [Filimonas zeae]GGH59885.1 cyclic nucleotide-binding protein [Filimonas zeae]